MPTPHPPHTHATPPAGPLLAGIGWRQPHYTQVLAQRPALAFLEVHSENFFAPGGAALAVLMAGRQHYPISLHGVGLSLGSATGLDDWHLDQLARLTEQVDPVRISDHASFARSTWRNGDGTGRVPVHAADLLPVPWTHEALSVMCANVQRVQDRLRRPIAVENLSAYLQWAQADWTEPAFLAELSRRTGCQLLVDVNNLMVNARNRHLANPTVTTTRLVADCCGWINALNQALGPAAAPGGQGHHPAIAEIHLAGHTHAGDIVIDDHGSRVSEPVWAVYAHALATWGAVPSLIEWDTDIPDLDVLLSEASRADQLARQMLPADGKPRHNPMPPATAAARHCEPPYAHA
ncbi:MAG: DUF692 domain-containing protein [Burkholderiales bacterium]|nr:DUF692 domain-containing protein [Burkholderiales bacterium]